MRHRNDPEGLAGRKLYLGGLLEDVRKEELTKELARFGPLDDVWIARNPPGFAFVVYQRDADAERCARALDGMNVCGSRIRVEFAHRLHKDAPSGKFASGALRRESMERTRDYERGPRGGSERAPRGAFDRGPRGEYADRPGYSGRPHGREYDDRPAKPFDDELDRYSRPRYIYGAPWRRAGEPSYAPADGAPRFRHRYSPEYDSSDDMPPPTRRRSRSRSFAVSPDADADDYEPPLRRALPPDDDYVADFENEREPRRRSPYSPPPQLSRPRRYHVGSAADVDVGYRRSAAPDEGYSRRGGPPPFRERARDRSPLAMRSRATDEYAGYYGNQTPLREHEERDSAADEDEYLPYDMPSPLRLGRPR